MDKAARQALYTEGLTTLHDEAIFLPLTGKRQTAVANKRVSGFKFGFLEYDFPLANLGLSTYASTHYSLLTNRVDELLAEKAQCAADKSLNAAEVLAKLNDGTIKVTFA